jgi:hypothetical protein
MKVLQNIKSDFFATLWELQNTNPQQNLKEYLLIKIGVLFDIIEDELDDEYIEQYFEVVNK